MTIGILPDPPNGPPVLISSNTNAIYFAWSPTKNTYGSTLINYIIYSNDVLIGKVPANILEYTMNSELVHGNSYKIQISSVSYIV